jgi:hypothetical protein
MVTITLSLVIVFALGVIMLLPAFVLSTGCNKHLAERRGAREGPEKDKRPPRWQHVLNKGSARHDVSPSVRV